MRHVPQVNTTSHPQARGVPSPPCMESAVRAALDAYGDQLRRVDPIASDLDEAQDDLDTLRRLREMVALELRRVADLVDELETDGGAPTITAQVSAVVVLLSAALA